MKEEKDNPLIINTKKINAVLARLSAQIVELIYFYPNLKIIAVQPRGLELAEHICNQISSTTGIEIKPGKIDPTFYRDDIGTKQGILYPNESYIDFEITNEPVLLVDDVIYTGRTIRAAMDAVMDLGRPKWIKLMVLVNRHLERELPISVTYEGLRIDSESSEKIKIKMDGENSQVIITKEKHGQI